jgi:replication factor A1
MATEEIIEQILSKRPEISRSDVIERLEKERRKTGGFISDEILLRMIAVELGVEISVGTSLPTLLIADLIPGLSDITVVGRLVAVFPPRNFGRYKGGKIASLLIADKSGLLRVVLWNDKASLVESDKLKVGRIIRFSHGYTKEGLSGKVELHVGDSGEIEINPNDVEAKDYPSISKFTTRIGQITSAFKDKKVNVVGTVKEVYPASTFQRKDSSSGKVMRFVLSDETGEIPVVVWNEKVDELEKTLKKGVGLQVVGAKVKKAMGEGLEIHVDAQTYVEKLASLEEFSKIADLKEGVNHVNVEGEVVTKPIFRDVKTSKDELVKLAIFELRDETGKIWVSAWRKHAESVKDLEVGDKIVVKNAYVKKGFGEQLEISTRTTTSITIIH